MKSNAGGSMMSESGATDPPSKDEFATTHWSIVVAAGDRNSAESHRALESLCEAYWYPLYAYVRRRVGDATEAEDLTQSFFATLLEKNFVGMASEQRGRFRSFLLAALKHYLSNQWRDAKTIKRGGGRSHVSLDFESAEKRYRIEPVAGLTAEQIYERNWAIALLNRTITRLEDEFIADGKFEQFRQLKGLAIGEGEGMSFREVAADLGTTEAAAKMAASRMRQRYRRLLRDEIMQTVSCGEQVDQEIRELFNVLGR